MDLVKLSTSALTLIALAVAGTAFSGPALAAGSAEAGQAKSVTCSACHGMDGNSLNPEWPSLAGQHESYIVKSLQSFKSGARQNVLMSSMALPLTDEDMVDLAAYFSAQKRAGGAADPALVSAGERLYRGGNKETGVPACLACHGPTGQGNPAAGWPAIAGQHAAYSAAQLAAYRAKQRATDGDTQMMRNVSAMLTDDEIKAVASYIQGLR
jgi:cytochrome c553